MIIPREKRLVRVYVEISISMVDQYKMDNDPGVIMRQVETVMKPYSIKAKHVDWSTVYTVPRLSPELPFRVR
jgi:phenol 2-monooxygenase